ncbi:MAG: beta-ketoacyl-ACP synthase II [Candidatus Dormibacteria bacterium]
MNGTRIVITGIGAVTPLGNDAATSWAAVRAGRSGIGPITHFDASAFPSRIAGEVRGFDAAAIFGVKEARRGSRPIHLAMTAAREAVSDSGLDVSAQADDIAVCIGSGIGGLEILEIATRTVDKAGPQRVSPFAAAAALIDMAPGMIAIDLGVHGPNIAVVSACASGADALGQAAEWIRRGDATAVVAGGSEAAVTATGMAMFGAARALSRRNDDPQHASRPFDRDRDGFVAAEGAAIVVLEEREHAISRGARIYGELVGYSATSDAHHITAPHPDGTGAVLCVRRALQRAGITPGDVDYVNAHGTGTELNDVAETQAFKTALGDRAFSVPISSTKSMTGHLLGAAGAFEAIVCLLAIGDGYIPPTINLDTPDPECDLDYVPHTGRGGRLDIAISTSFGFGGHNACLVLRRDESTA